MVALSTVEVERFHQVEADNNVGSQHWKELRVIDARTTNLWRRITHLFGPTRRRLERNRIGIDRLVLK